MIKIIASIFLALGSLLNSVHTEPQKPKTYIVQTIEGDILEAKTSVKFPKLSQYELADTFVETVKTANGKKIIYHYTVY